MFFKLPGAYRALRSPNDFKEEIRIKVDLDAESGQRPREPRKDGVKRDNTHNVRIVKASNGKINMAAIKAYLEGTIDFSTHLLEAISQVSLCLIINGVLT